MHVHTFVQNLQFIQFGFKFKSLRHFVLLYIHIKAHIVKVIRQVLKSYHNQSVCLLLYHNCSVWLLLFQLVQQILYLYVARSIHDSDRLHYMLLFLLYNNN